MKIRIQLLLLILGMGLFTGCNEDEFLNVPNENELSSSNYYTNVQNFELALNAVYSALKNEDLYGQNYYVENLLPLAHESEYWSPQSRNEVTSSDGGVFIAWRGWYRLISRANDVIENVPVYIEKFTPNETDVAALNKILGQAKFLRGFAYFHMVRMWGEGSYKNGPDKLSIPLILKVATTRAEMMVPRATVSDVYTQILEDLKEAETLLPDSWDAANIARIDKYAVKAYLGQVYLFMEDYNQAKVYFEQIITNSSFSLLPYNEYREMFQGKHEFSSESILEINHDIDMSQNIWENGLASGIAIELAPVGRGWSNVTPHSVNIDRFGSDPRLHVCTIHPDSLVATTDGKMEKAGNSLNNVTGHFFRKYVPIDYVIYNTNSGSDINFILMRLADVYLMYAEVMNVLSDDAAALEYVNKVKRRAYGFDPNTPRPEVDYAGLTGGALRDRIREERFLELFAEGHRWFDIVRW
ncbi:MAG TPA: RagB/SusD family nutrient uptake outer membrane protein, partial [Cytophagales bacterium]|nr:RagB/SusD family nutrient uptake outer membrane protein [Cytophagales bacterium]